MFYTLKNIGFFRARADSYLSYNLLIIYMKKLLESDWLRAVQFSSNTTAKRVTPVQITHRYSGL